MIFVENESGNWTKWAVAIDEAYGSDPYADLQIKICKSVWRHKVKLDDIKSVALMLRSVADDLEAVEKSGRARQRFREQCLSGTSPETEI